MDALDLEIARHRRIRARHRAMRFVFLTIVSLFSIVMMSIANEVAIEIGVSLVVFATATVVQDACRERDE